MLDRPTDPNRSMLTLCTGALLGVAGTYLYQAMRQRVDALPEGSKPSDILKAMNPLPAVAETAKAASNAVEEAASAAKDKFNKNNN